MSRYDAFGRRLKTKASADDLALSAAKQTTDDAQLIPPRRVSFYIFFFLSLPQSRLREKNAQRFLALRRRETLPKRSRSRRPLQCTGPLIDSTLRDSWRHTQLAS